MPSSDPPPLTTTSVPPVYIPPPVAPVQATLSVPVPQGPQPYPQDFPANGEGSNTRQKRTHFESSLPSDEFLQSSHPCKMPKVLTTVAAKRKQELTELHSRRMLELARASREAFAAQAKYRLARIRELDVMRTIAHEEYEEARSFLRDADRQIGEIRHAMRIAGTLYTDHSFRLEHLPTDKHYPEVPSCSDWDGSDDIDPEDDGFINSL